MVVHAAHKELLEAHCQGVLTPELFADIYEKAMSSFDRFTEEMLSVKDLVIPSHLATAMGLVAKGVPLRPIVCFGGFDESEVVKYFTASNSALRPSADSLDKLVAWQEWFALVPFRARVKDVKARAGIPGRCQRLTIKTFSEKFGMEVRR
jgi:hypothetical protein